MSMVFVVGDSAFRRKQQVKQAITQMVYGGCYINNARHPFIKLNQAAALLSEPKCSTTVITLYQTAQLNDWTQQQWSLTENNDNDNNKFS